MIADVMVRPEPAVFAAFVRDVEPRLRRALVVSFGPVEGRAATVDALSWAWEHWHQLGAVANKPGYLYRVGQSASRRHASRPLPTELLVRPTGGLPEFEPGLMPALNRLSVQQRTVVVLVHGFQWSQVEVSDLLEISPSTVQKHLNRAMSKLRDELEGK
jgi:DNA-directed RNA polymerase specialized sigma24 family protein